jgi:hypothetical protein
MPPKFFYYSQKMIQRYFTIIKFYLFSLGDGNLKILTEARSKIVIKFWQKFERFFNDKKTVNE